MRGKGAAVGRPREFDVDEALDRAMGVFWRKGYDGASLPDLTAAMGINRPSLYAAFGNKESLFRKALDRYVEGPAAHVRDALAADTARKVAEGVLYGSVDLIADKRRPRGCLLVQGALACGSDSDPVRRAAAKLLAAGELALRDRFELAKIEGDLPPNSDPASLARYVTAVNYGLAVLASGGASAAELRRVVDFALEAWPA
jgi:AcrR family transcriptional regulator